MGVASLYIALSSPLPTALAAPASHIDPRAPTVFSLSPSASLLVVAHPHVPCSPPQFAFSRALHSLHCTLRSLPCSILRTLLHSAALCTLSADPPPPLPPEPAPSASAAS